MDYIWHWLFYYYVIFRLIFFTELLFCLIIISTVLLKWVVLNNFNYTFFFVFFKIQPNMKKKIIFAFFTTFHKPNIISCNVYGQSLHTILFYRINNTYTMTMMVQKIFDMMKKLIVFMSSIIC